MTTVLAHGVFDVLHAGHTLHLQKAKSLGDELIVSVTADAFVNKGPGRPVFKAEERMQVLLALECVDSVFITYSESAVDAINEIMPDIYVKGAEYESEDTAGNLPAEQRALKTVGGKLVYTDTMIGSSSKAINRLMPTIPDRALKYLDDLRRDYDWDAVHGWLQKASNLRCAVVGERITDEYVYVEPSGKSPKENLITYVLDDTAVYSGGADVITEHLKEFTESCVLWSAEMAVTKTRMVEKQFTNKVFSMAQVPLIWSFSVSPSLTRAEMAAADYDLGVIADFGHGLFSCEADTDLAREIFPWIALTVQTNSLNYGFNRLTKWKSAEYVVADTMEIQLALGDANVDVISVLPGIAEMMHAEMVTVTRGHHGCAVYADNKIAEAPALTDRAVDRLGSGDAFLGFTAPLAKLGAPPEIVALVGSAASAIHVGKPGNESVKKQELYGFLKSILA